MAYLVNEYCHANLEEAAKYLYSIQVGVIEAADWPTSYSFDINTGSVTVYRNDPPRYDQTVTLDTCAPLGYPPYIPVTYNDLFPLWGAVAVVIFTAWAFKMAKRAL